MILTKLIEKANSELNANLSLAKLCNDYIKNKGLIFGYNCGASSFFSGNCENAIREYINELYADNLSDYDKGLYEYDYDYNSENEYYN